MASLHCLWHGTTKDRKAIVKSLKVTERSRKCGLKLYLVHSFKENYLAGPFFLKMILIARFPRIIFALWQTYVEKTCLEEFGHLVLMAIFDTVDDTKLVAKAILGEVTENFKKVADSLLVFLVSLLPAPYLLVPCLCFFLLASLLLVPCLLPNSWLLTSSSLAPHQIVSDKYGLRVVKYLVGGRNPTYIYPDAVKLLQQGDGNSQSKKDPAVRRKELTEVVAPTVLK